MNETLKVKKLNPEARLPAKAYYGDLGFDLNCLYSESLQPKEVKVINTGIACQFPEGFGGLILDRSSISSKRGLFVVGGVIDSHYTGELKVCLYNSTDDYQTFLAGDKIAQLMLIPVHGSRVEEVVELIETARSDKGFGSTGA